MKIAVIISAFNKPECLDTCLSSIYSQSRSPDTVIVIDNSTDSRIEKEVVPKFPNIQCRHFPKNIGSAGAYHEGIKLASNNSDYIWVLDQDITAEPQSLRELVACLETFPPDTPLGAIRGGWGKKTGDQKRITSFAWRGVLLSTAAVKACGLPMKEFFLYAGDVEYSFRLIKSGYHIYAVYAGKLREISPTKRKDIKVLGLTFSYYTEPYRLYYAHRNGLYLYKSYKRIILFFKMIVYGLRGIIVFILTGKPANASAILNGLWDGLRGKLGKSKRYSP